MTDVSGNQAIEKFDISKIFPKLYSASSDRATLVEAPAMRTLAINGEGDSTGPRYNDSVAALYAVAYALKSLPSEGITIDGFVNFNIVALECLWSSKAGGMFNPANKSDALWELCIVVPGFVTPSLVRLAQIELMKKETNQAILEVHVNSLQEKKSAQILHRGSHENIPAKFAKLQSYLKRTGYKPSSRFHEIYLNDVATTKKAALRTILRQPVVKLR